MSVKDKEVYVFSLLLVVLLAISEVLLAHNTLYTEGEIIQGLYWLLVALNVPIFLLTLFEPRVGRWCALGLGAILLPWQTYENRKLVLIHEEVLAIVGYLENQKSGGSYPQTLDDYEFTRPWVSRHVSCHSHNGTYKITYFMDQPGISYWYSSWEGFFYYPD